MDLPDDRAGSMYVQLALKAVFDGSALTLLDLAPATLLVAEDPVTSVGHLPTGLFLDHWYSDPDGPGTRAVPAVLALLDADQSPDSSAHLMLRLPRIRQTGVEYQVEVVDGELLPTAGACVLFIRPPVPPGMPIASPHTPMHDNVPSPAA